MAVVSSSSDINEPKQEQIKAMSKTATKEVTNAIEWDVIDGENTDFAAQYPRMQWVHGSKQAAGFMKTGGLFIAKEQYPNFPGEGFTATTLITREGTEIEGYAATQVKLAVIRVKHQWVKDENYGRNVPLVHALVAVKGCDDLLVISLRGAAKSLEFQKAFNLHMSQPVAVANRTRPEGSRALEPFALWFALNAGDLVSITSKDGKSTSIVTPFELSAPDVIDRDYAVSLWVGPQNYKQFVAFWKDTEKWQKTPIWEQKADNGHDSDTPMYSGDEDPNELVGNALLKQLMDLALVKGYEEAETMRHVSNGTRTHYDQLTNGEARQVIANLKAV